MSSGGSDYVHFSLAVATNEMRDVTDVHFDAEQPELAHEGLYLAVLIYGVFLEHSEKTVRHGMTPHVLNLVKSSPAFGADSTT